MGRMTVVLAGDENVACETMCLAKRALKLGYPVRLWDLNEVTNKEDLTRNTRGFIPCWFKPKVILESLRQARKVAYLDSDIAMIKHLPVFRDDIGVVLRPVDEVQLHRHVPEVGLYNTGVLFFSVKAKGFLTKWLSLKGAISTEQEALNRLLQNPPKDLRLGIYPAEEFNAYTLTPKTHLLHLKGGKGYQMHKYHACSCKS